MRGCFLCVLFSLLFIHAAQTQVNLTNGLVAYYPFTGNANDSSGNNHTGQLINGVQLTADRFGNDNSAYLFDGVDDYIKVPDNGAFSTPHFSIVIWFQSHSDNLQNLIGKRDFTTVGGTAGAQYQFFINYPPFPGIGSNLVGNNSSCTNIGSSSYLNTNDWICRTKWYCAVITFDGSRHKIYIDGVLKRNEPTSFNGFLSCASDLRFGNWWQGDLIPFNGIMDDIRWYNRALNQQEITALYANFQTISGQCSANTGAGFLTPDTVCVNSPVSINNTSKGASTYYWNFCVANSTTNPAGINLGNFGFSTPVFSDYVQEGNNFYAFVTNNIPGKLVRLAFGNSLLNTPTATDFGDLGGVIPNQCEGIQVIKNEGRWYAIIVGGQPTGRIVKVDFGNSLSNNAPAATNWGNVGNLQYPTDLHIFKDGTSWYGLTINAISNTITRFNFTSSFNNVPAGTNLGNIGGLNYPTGIYAISKNGTWHAFVSNAGAGLSNSSDASLTRLDFGNSLLNMPTGTNLGNPGNALSSSRDLTIYESCNEIFGFVVNNASSKEIIRLNFNNLLTATPTATVLGNSGNLSFPHSVSKLFRVENDLYSFITNVNNNTISRLKFGGCGSSSISSSTAQNPSPITYNAVGTYSINLAIDDGLPTQSAYCKTVVVVDNVHTPKQNKAFCSGDSVLLTSSKLTGNVWNTGSNANSIYVKAAGIYWVRSSNGGCANIDSFIVSVNALPVVNIGSDTSLCSLDSLVLNAGNLGATYSWQNGHAGQRLTVKQDGLYHVTVTKDGCSAKDSILISVLQSPTVTLSNDTAICKSSTVILIGGGGANYAWHPAAGLTNSTTATTSATPDTTTKYYLTVTNSNQCSAKDSVTITVKPVPKVNIGIDTSLCTLDSLVLDAKNPGAKYTWQNGQSTQTFTVIQGGIFHVSVDLDGCVEKDSIAVTELQSPVTTVSNDTAICQSGFATLTASGGDSYRWAPATGLTDTTVPNVVASPDTTTTYYLTATGVNGCESKDTVTVTVSPKPDFSVASSKPVVCKGDTVLLRAAGGDRYTWSPTSFLSDPENSLTQAFSTVTTLYQVIIEDGTCHLTDTLFLNIPVVDKPETSVTKSNDINCFMGQAKLNASGGANRYLWRPSAGLSDSTIRNPIATLGQTTTYHVFITTNDGCQVQDSITVNVENGTNGTGFPVPSAFTPNSDAKNDCFGVQHWGAATDFSLTLYNRWGEVIFHTDNPSQCWNGIYKGVAQPSDVYVYLIKAKTRCGKVFRKGTFALIR